MTITQLFNAPRRDQILENAISRKLRTSLSLRAVQGWHTYKAVLASGDKASRRLKVKLFTPGGGPPPTPLPQPEDSVGVTFRLNHRKCLFSTVVESVRQEGGEVLLTLGWPDHLQQMQRRAFERAEVPSGSVIAVRFWRDDDSSGGDRDVRHGQLENLSASGMCLKAADFVGANDGDAYKCVFAPSPNAPSLILDARLQHREAAEQGRALFGFQFVGLEATAEGRSLLDRLAQIVSRFHHAQARAARTPAGRSM